MGIFHFLNKRQHREPVPAEPAVTVPDSVSPDMPFSDPPVPEPEQTYILRLVDEATGNSVCAPFPGTATERDIIRYFHTTGVLTPFPQAVKIREWHQNLPYPANLRNLNPAHLENLHIGVQMNYLPYLQHQGKTDCLYQQYLLAFRMPDGNEQTFVCMGYETPDMVLKRMEKTGFLIKPFFADSQCSWEIRNWPGIHMDAVEKMNLPWPEARFYHFLSGAPVCDFDGNPGSPLSIVVKEDNPRDYVCLYGCPRAEGTFRRDQVLNPQVDVIHYEN